MCGNIQHPEAPIHTERGMCRLLSSGMGCEKDISLVAGNQGFSLAC